MTYWSGFDFDNAYPPVRWTDRSQAKAFASKHQACVKRSGFCWVVFKGGKS